MNGVDTPALFATIDAVRGQRELARFQFRATNRWVSGTHSETRFEAFTGAGGRHEQAGVFLAEGDHPPVLCGKGEAPTPVEYLLHALASCIMAGIGNIAAARGVRLTRAEISAAGDIDLQGLLGISNDVRNGYEGIGLDVKIEGDASPEVLADIVERSKARSAVFDVLTNGVPVQIQVGAR